MTKSYIKEAEQNVINNAKFWTEFIEMIDSMQSGVSDISDHWQDNKKFNEGFRMLRHAAYDRQQEAFARCFAFVGVGGKEAEEFSKERAKKLFGGDYSVVQYLDSFICIPSSWHTEAPDALRQELKQAIENNESKESKESNESNKKENK